MTAQPNPEPLTLEEAAAAIFNAQLAVKSLCEARDVLTGQIAEQYRTIEDAGYELRLHLSETKATSAIIGGYEVEAKLDHKRLKVAHVVFGSTGESRIIPTCNTSRIVVRKAKP